MSTRESRDLDAALERIHAPRPGFWLACENCEIRERFDMDDAPERCKHCGTAYDDDLRDAEQKAFVSLDQHLLELSQELVEEAEDLWADAKIAAEHTSEPSEARIVEQRRRYRVRGSWEDRT